MLIVNIDGLVNTWDSFPFPIQVSVYGLFYKQDLARSTAVTPRLDRFVFDKKERGRPSILAIDV